MVPNSWMSCHLGDFMEFKNGLNADKSQYGYGLKFVNVMDVFGNDILTEDKIIGRVNVAESQLESNLLKFGDVLFNRTSETFDEIAMSAVYLDDKPAVFGGFVIRARPSNGILSPAYSVYLFQSSKFRNQVIKLGQGAVRANIGQKDLAKVKVSLPPLPEQKKIAQILSTWDKAITVTEKLLANSQQQKKALMQQLLTGKKRLLDKNGVRFSGEWKKGKLSDIANIDSGYAFKSNDFTDSDKGIPIIRMSDFKAGGIDISSAAKVIPESTIGLDRFKLKTGDFVFGMSGSLSNYGWVKEQDLPCFLNQRVGRILAKECAVQLFVTYLYLSDKIQQSILDKAAGAAQLNISSTDLRTTIVHYPSYEEQQKIAAVLSNADQEISALQQKLNALKQEKKALMQQLLTGKRRVRVD